MLAVRVDTFPVVVTTFGDGFDAGEFALFRDAQISVIERRLPYVSVVDTSALVTMPSLDLREAVTSFTGEYQEHVAKYCLATEIVVCNVAVRTALSAIQWLVPESSKVSLHASLRPAVSRALDAVWTNQLPTTDTLLAFHDEIMSRQSVPPARQSGAFTKRAISSSIEGLLRRARRADEG